MIAIPPSGLETAFWAGFGLCLGSFVNVLACRLPAEQSILRPASRCPKCSKPISFYDNVPVLSFLLLGGRCRRCRKPISRRYPLVEAACGVLGAGLSLRWPGEALWTALALGAGAVLVAVTLIDWDTFLIPDALSVGLLAAGLLAAPLNPLFEGSWGVRWLHSLGGAAAGFFGCWAVAEVGERMFKKEAMGGGDVKLLAAVGAWSGALGAFDCMVVGSAIGALYGIGLLLLKRIRREDPIPFGPFLSAGALLNFFYLLPFGFPFP